MLKCKRIFKPPHHGKSTSNDLSLSCNSYWYLYDGKQHTLVCPITKWSSIHHDRAPSLDAKLSSLQSYMQKEIIQTLRPILKTWVFFLFSKINYNNYNKLKKTMKKQIIIGVTIGLLLPSAAQANFPDVPENHPNYKAITYLKANQIVEGNPDGTFKPQNTLNRAELTKIAVLSAELPLVSDLNCFPDVSKDAWFAPFVCTAKAFNIVQGYPDGTFKPSNQINRAEAFKIISESQNLPTTSSSSQVAQDSYGDYDSNQWYSGYLNHLSEQNYLPFKLNIQASKELQRREFSEIYYRLLSSQKSKFQEEFPDTEHKINGNPEEILLMLDLINQERTSRGLVPVDISNELSYMAELHSEDMVSRNFFSHENPDGKNIDTRRKELGIQTFVGENISKNISVQASHNSLMQSPPHKANILNPDWNRLGLGIIKNGNTYYVSQEFSIYETDTENLITQIVSQSNTSLKTNNTLISAAQKWAIIMAENQETSTTINGLSFSDLDELKNTTTGAAVGSATMPNDLKILIESQLSFLESQYSEVGYATAKDKNGQIYFILITK